MTSSLYSPIFTNALDETIEICLELLFYKKREIKGMLKEDIKELLTHAVKSSTFIFNDVYRLTEERWAHPFETCFSHHNIKFSCEEEKDNKISFLEISISKNNNALETSIFRKPTFSAFYTNFNSFLSTQYKRHLLHTLLYRTYNMCSSYFQIHEEINHLKSVWQKNSFFLFFIDNRIHKLLNKLFIKDVQNSTTTQKKKVIISLEYLGKISLLSKKQLKNIFRSCHRDIKLNFVFKPSN